MKTFEKPLSAKEENEYLKKYREGDEKAGEILILRNMRLVAHMVKHYVPADCDRSEMISIGTIGLIKAVKTYDDTKGSRFATYAAKCIDNEILMALRGNKKKSKEVSLQEPIGTDKEGNEVNIIDVIQSDDGDFLENYILKNDIKILLEGIDGVLSDREREIIVRRYGICGQKEETQREISAGLGISRSYVSRIEKKAIEKLRLFFESKT